MSLKRYMPLERIGDPRPDALNQLAGITGIGWTVSILGYLGTIVGYGSSFLSRLVVDPQSLLYLGGALFLATFGLDRWQKRVTNSED